MVSSMKGGRTRDSRAARSESLFPLDFSAPFAPRKARETKVICLETEGTTKILSGGEPDDSHAATFRVFIGNVATPLRKTAMEGFRAANKTKPP